MIDFVFVYKNHHIIKIHTLIVDNVVEFAMLVIVNRIPKQPKHQILYSAILYDSIESQIQFSKLHINKNKKTIFDIKMNDIKQTRKKTNLDQKF